MARRWPPQYQGFIDRIMGLRPADLPPAFVLHSLPSPYPPGVTDHVRVFDAEAWLSSIKRDLAEGPAGPRARTGALQEDLIALDRILKERVAT